MNLRAAFGAFGLGFGMLVACIVSFGLNAPTVVGALFLVAFVACGLIGFLLAMRSTSRFKAQTRAAQQQQAQGRDPWQD